MSLREQVNASGFPLQLALANLVRTKSLGWRVLYEEHAWRKDDEHGFLDLVLEDQHQTWLMNIECKRVRDSDWVFLRRHDQANDRRHAGLWVTLFLTDESLRHYGWFDIPMDPSSPESGYCVVPGHDQRTRPLIEKAAATLVTSTESLASEETGTISKSYSTLRIYQNVIVTTATLRVCDVNVPEIDLTNGNIGDSSTFKEVPFVRFRKQLGARSDNRGRADSTDALVRNSKRRESTVFVVNSSHLESFLASCELPDRFEQYLNAR